MTIGERIKFKREELNISQDELARRLGYKSRSSINKIELGLQNLNQSKIKARATFKKKIYEYCENMGITCNPKHLFENDADKHRKCFKARLST